MYSVIVVKGGKIIAERYYNGKTINDFNNIHSVTKSICSALIGIAFDRGYLTDVDSKLIEYFPEYAVLPDVDPRLEEITLRHILTMQAGFRFYETLESWIPYVESENWTEYALQLSFIHAPGTRYHYSTPQTNLMANIIPSVTDMSTMEFAAEYLFECLGIEVGYWLQDPQGNYTGGHELYITPRDMAQFGLLYLNEGDWFGTQIISEEWYHESTIKQVERYSPFEEIENGYGYYWRTVDQDQSHLYYALGKGGQIIYIVPDLDLVVVTAADGEIRRLKQKMTGSV
jgi:CubicO group peptidase (beta-lactamase class C family)